MFNRILVPVDGSEPSLCGLRQAIALAAPGHATLVVLNVAGEVPSMIGYGGVAAYAEIAGLLQQAGREVVDKAARQAQDAGVACESFVIDGGGASASDVIVDQAGKQHCDLIAMGTHGRRGLKRLTLGSDAELVVRNAPVPVLLVKAPAAA